MNNSLQRIRRIFLRVLASKNPVSRNVIQLKRHYRLKSFQKNQTKILEICGGKTPLQLDYLNVDILDWPTIDVLADLHETLPFETNSIDTIISVATLEHFHVPDIKKILLEFHRILKSGGVLEIGIPSLEKIITYYKTNGCDDVVLRYLHGAQKDIYDIHLCIADFQRFKHLLEEAGFTQISEQPYDYPRHDKTMMMKICAKKHDTVL